MKKRIRLVLMSVSFVFLFVFAASANLITNGSFEEGNYVSGAGYVRLAAGSTDITGWVVGGDGLDWHIIDGDTAHFGRNGVDGSQYAVDLSKDGQSGTYSIAQTFNTVAGAEYQLTFLLGAPYFDTGVTVSVAGVSQDYSLASQAQYGFEWATEVLKFTAVDSATTLVLTNITGGYWAPVIDNVSVEALGASAVPEPASLLLLGLGLLGAGMVRKLKK